MAVIINEIAGFGAVLSKPQKTTLTVIGDSWVAAEIDSDAVSASARGVSVNTNMHLKNYFQIADIKGTSGERLDEIAARFGADVVADAPGYCMIIGGLNDLIANRTGAQMYASMKSMIDAAVASRITPIVLPCNIGSAPWTNGVGSQADVEARLDEWSEYNRLLRNYAYENPGWIYAESALNDVIDHEYNDPTYSVNCPSLLDSCAISANGSTVDTSHPGAAGAFRIGKAVATQLAAILPAADNLPHHYNDRTSGCWNCMQKIANTPSSAAVADQSVAATVTGTAAEGWMTRFHINDTGANGTLTQQARTDIDGGYWTRNVADTVAKGCRFEFRESDPGAFGYTANKHLLSDYGISVGDTVIFTFELKLHTIGGEDRINNFSGWVAILDSGNGAVDTLKINKNGGSTAEDYVGADFTDTPLVISSFPYVIPATSDYWYVYAEAQVSNGSHVVSTTDYTFELGRIGLRKIA